MSFTIRRLSPALLLFAGLLHAAQVTVTVLATTDLHGNLVPVDYVTGSPAPRGLAKLATVIRAVRAENPNTMLIDCGDTIQGTPLESVYQQSLRAGHSSDGDPMMRAMNLLGYDAMTLGNHEFNAGLSNLDRARRDANFPWLSANTGLSKLGRNAPFPPYIVKTVAGIRVAVIGVTTTLIPLWEKPENLGDYRFTSPIEAVQMAVAKLRRDERPDVILVAAHSGLGRNLQTGAAESPVENVVYDLAKQVPDLDAVVFGHSHSQLAGTLVGKVLLVQPKNAGASLARLDFVFDGKLISKKARLIPVTAETPAAADLMELAKPYEAAAQRYLNTPVATSARELTASRGREEDTAIVDAIQRAQLFYAKADVSFTALFDPAVRIPRGQVTVRQLAALYPYENELFAIDGTGKMVKDALENAARYYSSKSMPGFNYDMAEGVDYEIDRARPEGDRILNLRWKGRPLDPAQKLRIVVNNYRAGGTEATKCPRRQNPWRLATIRELLIRYYTERKTIPTDPTNNWKLKD